MLPAKLYLPFLLSQLRAFVVQLFFTDHPLS
ncbi:MAG: hypothetical protein RLZ97_643, partial [Verrucomicrobiota bacterium]